MATPHRTFRPRSFFFAFLAVASLASPASAAEEGAEEKAAADKPAVVEVDRVKTEPLNQTFPVLGRIVPRSSGPVAVRIGGPVGEMRVQVGDDVEADQILAVLVKDSFEWTVKLNEARVAQAEATIKTARAEADLLAQEVSRLEKLRKSAAFSQARLDDKRQELIKAKSAISETVAALMSAKAQLRLAEIDLYNADIRAPYAGVVSQRHTEVGAYITAGQPVVTLIDDRHLEIEADVPANRVGGLGPGTPVTIHLDPASPALRAEVRAAIPDENPLTRTRMVRFTPLFKQHELGLATNQSVVLDIPAGEAREVVTVHKDAIIDRKGKKLVFLAEDGKATIRPVSLGEAVGSRFEVLGGLRPGDPVVVRGNERLRPGQEITFGTAPGGGSE